jgi:hypothetical protein
MLDLRHSPRPAAHRLLCRGPAPPPWAPRRCHASITLRVRRPDSAESDLRGDFLLLLAQAAPLPDFL